MADAEKSDEQPPVKKRPKRPRTAYAFYVQQNYRTMANQWKPINPKEALRRMARMWEQCPEPTKRIYQEMQQQDRERYKKERMEWTKEYGGRPPKQRHRKREFDAPPRTRNAFIFYEQQVWKEVREEMPTELTQRDVVKEIAKRWRNLTPEQKKPYQDKAKADKKRYDKEKKAFKIRLAEMSAQQRADLLMEHFENERREALQFDPARRYIYEPPPPPAGQGPIDQPAQANEAEPEVQEVEAVLEDEPPNEQNNNADGA